MATMTRSLTTIDDELFIERAIWQHEKRAGRTNRDAQAAMRRIDKLLDERNRATDRDALLAHPGGTHDGETHQTHQDPP